MVNIPLSVDAGRKSRGHSSSTLQALEKACPRHRSCKNDPNLMGRIPWIPGLRYQRRSPLDVTKNQSDSEKGYKTVQPERYPLTIRNRDDCVPSCSPHGFMKDSIFVLKESAGSKTEGDTRGVLRRPLKWEDAINYLLGKLKRMF